MRDGAGMRAVTGVEIHSRTQASLRSPKASDELSDRHVARLAEKPVRRSTLRFFRTRSRILSVTRHLLSSGSYRELTIRDVARISEVSVPTIYSLIGGRSELICSAIRELCDVYTTKAERLMLESSPAVALTGAMFDLLFNERDYSAGVFLAMLDKHGDNEIARNMSDYSRATWRRFLTVMMSHGKLRTGTSIDLLAHCIVDFRLALESTWAAGRISDAEFRSRTVYGVGALLLGSVVEKERDLIENWMRTSL